TGRRLGLLAGRRARPAGGHRLPRHRARRPPVSVARRRSAVTTAVRGAFRRVPLAAWLCALVAFGNATAWALLNPPIEVPDEHAHIYYVQQLAETGQVPKPTGLESISAQDSAVRVYSHPDDINVGFLARPAWTNAE